MTNGRTTVVDFVAEDDAHDRWVLVLVEEGPWSGTLVQNLRRIQERLYGCIDAALEGKVAEQFPRSKGKDILIRLDCYNVPKVDVEAFFTRFSEGIFAVDDYRVALDESEFIRGISFAIGFDCIH